MTQSLLPSLDCHAHIAPDVTPTQVAALGNATVFAMTRSLPEAQFVSERRHEGLVWGMGVHPGLAMARTSFDAKTFRALLPRFAVVGEVGIDSRGGDRANQRRIFKDVLTECQDHPVLISVHSNGAAKDVIDAIEEITHPGLILHWFTGDDAVFKRAEALDLSYSVNAGMSDEAIARLPPDRVLTETDFPAKKARAKRPADTAAIETRLAKIWGLDEDQVRHRVWVNLRRLATRTEALDRLPELLADFLLEI